MSGWIIALVLATAIIHASWNAVLRHGRDGLWSFTAIAFGAAAFSAFWLPFLPLPDVRAVPYIGASFLVHTAYSILLISGYRSGELGVVYPLARGSAPLLVTAGAALFAREYPGPAPLAAIGVISFGILSLSRHGLATATPPRTLLVALATGVTIATYSVIDGIGARLSGNAFSYAFWLDVVNFAPWPVILLVRRGSWRSQAAAARDGARAVLGGVMSVVAYAFVLWAMTKGALGIVSALRETSVVFAALIGWLFLGERFSSRRLAACGIIACGIMILAAVH